jgi:hypothetical protein
MQICSKWQHISGTAGSIHPPAVLTVAEGNPVLLITNLLAKCEVKCLNAGIKKLDLEGSGECFIALNSLCPIS